MQSLTRWCIDNRRKVFIAWVAIAVGSSVIAQAVGRSYSTNFTLPGTESQHALNLLGKEFPAQGGDVDTFVFHTSTGTVDSPAVKTAMTAAIKHLSGYPHVVTVVNPYGPLGAVEISHDHKTAFATINYDKRANLLPNNTGAPVLSLVKSIHVPGLTVAAGGQVIEQAEGFSIGPATTVGVIAALVILLITFGSMMAAGMPLVTAGLGLITGVALIGIATHLTSMSNVAPELALMIGLGVGIDYALFIVTRFKENYVITGDVELSIVEAMDTSGRAILLAGTTVVIALLGMFATGVSFMYGLAIASVLAVLLTLIASLTLLPSLLSRFGARIVRPRAAHRHGIGRRAAGSVPSSATGDGNAAAVATPSASRWRQWSQTVQSRPRSLACASLVVMVALLLPVFALRLNTSDAGNDPANLSSRHAFDLLAKGFGPGFNGPLLLVAELPARNDVSALPPLSAAVAATADVRAVTPPRIA